MGYCKPIPPDAQKKLDEQTSKRIMEARAKGEKIYTLHDLHRCPFHDAVSLDKRKANG